MGLKGTAGVWNEGQHSGRSQRSYGEILCSHISYGEWDCLMMQLLARRGDGHNSAEALRQLLACTNWGIYREQHAEKCSPIKKRVFIFFFLESLPRHNLFTSRKHPTSGAISATSCCRSLCPRCMQPWHLWPGINHAGFADREEISRCFRFDLLKPLQLLNHNQDEGCLACRLRGEDYKLPLKWMGFKWKKTMNSPCFQVQTGTNLRGL